MGREISHGNGFTVGLTFRIDLEEDNVLLGRAREEDSGPIKKDIKETWSYKKSVFALSRGIEVVERDKPRNVHLSQIT